MRRIAAERLDTGTDGDALALQTHITATRPVLLDHLPQRTLGLIADEQHVVPRISLR